MFKAKTKTKLIMVLNALLGVVFAFMVGFTFCQDVFSSSKTARTQQGSTANYLASNSYNLVNATKSNPIMFGPGARDSKVAIEYNLNYSFDVRLKYKLVWSDETLSIDNVILNFANRDRFIVDKEYIYLTEAIAVEKTETTDTRHGTLNIITGVQFTNLEDETYFGKTLTINIEEVKIAKSAGATYSEGHALYTSTIAGNAWKDLRSGSLANKSTANIIVYNSRYYDGTNVHNGLDHPDAVTAYKNDNGTDTTKLYGNRYYAGVGLYVMTGKSAVTLTVKSMGNWQKVSEYILNVNPVWATNTYYSKSGDSYTLLSEQPASWNTSYGEYYVKNTSAAFVNNIYYNFNSKWGTVTYDANHTISTITVAKNQQVYLDVYDSVEITAVMETESDIINYSGYKLVNSFYLNNSLRGEVGIEYLKDVVSEETVGTTYLSQNYTINNSTLYNPIFVDNYANADFVKESTNVSITNNTDQAKQYSIGYKSIYTTSNGVQVLQTGGGPTSSLTDTTWARVDIEGESNNINVVVAPYSTVSILDNIIAVNSITSSSLKVGSSAYYDAWLSYRITSVSESSASTNSTNSISVEAKNVLNGKEFYVRNNSNKTISIPSGNSITMFKVEYSYELITTSVSTWNQDYYKYFYKDANGNFVRATKANQFAVNKYYILKRLITSTTIVNNSAITLGPNETALFGSVGYTGELIGYTGSILSAGINFEENGVVSIVNNGTKDAYIVNNTTNSCYVRFVSNVGDGVRFIVDGNYCYYIGVLRPGQMVKVPCTEGVRIGAIGTIVADDLYDTDINAWNVSDTVKNSFNNYFN